MDTAILDKANKLSEEIKELDVFLCYAERVWKGKLTSKMCIGKLISLPYGAFGKREIELGTDLKNKMLDVLREHKEELEQQLIDL